MDKAVNQAQDYRDLLDADGEARKILESKGIRVWRPQIIVVVGKRDETFEEELIRTLLDRGDCHIIKRLTRRITGF